MGKQARRVRAQKALQDQTGTPGQRAQANPAEMKGVSGTPVYNGFIQINEKKTELVGQNRWDTYGDIMRNVSIVAAGMRYYLNLVSQPAWKAMPADKSGAKGEKIAEHVQRCMDKMMTPWNRVVKRTALFRTHGFSIQEWSARKEKDGSVGMNDVQSRPQPTIHQWDTTQQGEIRGVVQLSPHDGKTIYLPRAKFIYCVDDSIIDSPEGLGLLRHLAEPTRILHRYQQLEGWGFETDLRGIPIGRAPLQVLEDLVRNNTITSEQRDAIIDPLATFIQNHIKNPKLGILLDSVTYDSQDDASTPSSNKQWDLDLLKAGATGQAEVAAAIERQMRDIARVLGVEHLLMGDNGVGSFAMAKDKSHNFALMIDSTLRDIRQAFTTDWVARIMELNGWDESLTPTLVTDKLQYRSAEQVTAALADMARAGAVLAPNDPVVDALRDLLGLPHAPRIDVTQDASLLTAPKKPNPSTPVDQKPQD